MTGPQDATTPDGDWPALYRDLHAHPELAFQEERTARVAADGLGRAGYEVITGIGRTGVVGVLRRGSGPTVLLRADMDALPVHEETGLPYASSATGVGPDGTTVPVMHACGHDMHTTCLLAAAARLAGEQSWSGTLITVFQPAEEIGAGSRALVDDGLYDRVPRPDIVLGQHVAPLPAGVLGVRPGTPPAFAASDQLTVTLHGRGAHGSRPEVSVDPVLMAAATVVRLQGIVAREVGGTETAVLTVGSMHAGSAGNVIPDQAQLQLNVRTVDPRVRERVLRAIHRIVGAEAEASGAPRPPEIEPGETYPAVVNDPDACATTSEGFARDLPQITVMDPGSGTGSEDVGLLATEAGARCVYWILGGADPQLFAGVGGADLGRVIAGLPSNHSPQYAPVIDPTLGIGVNALVSAAHTWLDEA
ncbi:amidohydrolase [Nocardioides pantholopis]|uniref:amidohydrolase n=1 Tax=Nocardioides pantholopis TaxID=2483798 RepID=UPI000FD92044|nr:amidohydrolase [Nocardioides pantholopis]